MEHLRAAHAVELGFVFDDLASPDSLGLAGSTAMHRVKMFEGGANPVVYAPREEERAALTP